VTSTLEGKIKLAPTLAISLTLEFKLALIPTIGTLLDSLVFEIKK